MLAATPASRSLARLATGALRPSASIWRSGVPLAMGTASLRTSAVARASDKSMKIDNPFERNEKLGRPMSPHLSIYAWQITNTMSILNRITGSALGLVFYDYFATYALAPSLVNGAAAVSAAAAVPALLFLGKAGLTASFWYHFFGGVRHYLWDATKMLDLKNVYTTGYAAIGATVVATLATLFLM